jgi:hypothetical protein
MPGAVQPWPPAEYRLAPINVPDDRAFQGGDPLLDLPDLPPPGWFTNVEVGLIRAHFKNRLSGTVALTGGGTDTVAVGAADLDWTAAPRFDFGYRIPDGAGEILVSYRFLATDGQADVLGHERPVNLKTRLNVQVINLDFANRDPLWTYWRDPFYSRWEMRWRAGVQFADVYFDSRATLPGPALFQERETNGFFGVGPHAGLELFRRLNFPGLAVYGAVDGSGLAGHIHQTFAEFFTAKGFGPVGFGTYGATQGVGVIGAQLGLSWMPPGRTDARFFLGYQFEQWYQVGRNNFTSATGSVGELTEQGIFFRGEFTF